VLDANASVPARPPAGDAIIACGLRERGNGIAAGNTSDRLSCHRGSAAAGYAGGKPR